MDFRLMVLALQIAYQQGAMRALTTGRVPAEGSAERSQDMGEILAKVAKLQSGVKS